jgi:hypothetical protein
MARKFDSEIKIDESGNWYYKGSEITQENVLSFFKKSLREDEKGLYIENTYAELIEHGYVEAKYFPLFIKDYTIKNEEIFFGLENSIPTRMDAFNFYQDDRDRLFCVLKNSKFLKYGFNSDILQFLSKYLTENGEVYTLNLHGVQLDVQKFVGSIEVNLPIF